MTFAIKGGWVGGPTPNAKSHELFPLFFGSLPLGPGSVNVGLTLLNLNLVGERPCTLHNCQISKYNNTGKCRNVNSSKKKQGSVSIAAIRVNWPLLLLQRKLSCYSEVELWPSRRSGTSSGGRVQSWAATILSSFLWVFSGFVIFSTTKLAKWQIFYLFFLTTWPPLAKPKTDDVVFTEERHSF